MPNHRLQAVVNPRSAPVAAAEATPLAPDGIARTAVLPHPVRDSRFRRALESRLTQLGSPAVQFSSKRGVARGPAERSAVVG